MYISKIDLHEMEPRCYSCKSEKIAFYVGKNVGQAICQPCADRLVSQGKAKRIGPVRAREEEEDDEGDRKKREAVEQQKRMRDTAIVSSLINKVSNTLSGMFSFPDFYIQATAAVTEGLKQIGAPRSTADVIQIMRGLLRVLSELLADIVDGKLYDKGAITLFANAKLEEILDWNYLFTHQAVLTSLYKSFPKDVAELVVLKIQHPFRYVATIDRKTPYKDTLIAESISMITKGRLVSLLIDQYGFLTLGIVDSMSDERMANIGDVFALLSRPFVTPPGLSIVEPRTRLLANYVYGTVVSKNLWHVEETNEYWLYAEGRVFRQKVHVYQINELFGTTMTGFIGVQAEQNKLIALGMMEVTDPKLRGFPTFDDDGEVAELQIPDKLFVFSLAESTYVSRQIDIWSILVTTGIARYINLGLLGSIPAVTFLLGSDVYIGVYTLEKNPSPDDMSFGQLYQVLKVNLITEAASVTKLNPQSPLTRFTDMTDIKIVGTFVVGDFFCLVLDNGTLPDQIDFTTYDEIDSGLNLSPELVIRAFSMTSGNEVVNPFDRSFDSPYTQIAVDGENVWVIDRGIFRDKKIDSILYRLRPSV